MSFFHSRHEAACWSAPRGKALARVVVSVIICAVLGGLAARAQDDVFVEMHLLDHDAGAALPVVWFDLGQSQGVRPGDTYRVYHQGRFAGSLAVDTVLHVTSSGTLTPAPGYDGPLFDASFEFVNSTPRAAPGLDHAFRISDPGATALSLGAIRAPERGADIMGSPWRNEYDADLDSVFRTFAASGNVPGKAPPAPPQPGGPVKPPEHEIVAVPPPQAGYRLRELDPDLAVEIKSGFIVEAGDCLHAAPWPDRADGYFIDIQADQTILVPGPFFVSTQGKSITRLEKELRDLPPFHGSRVTITPCAKQ